MRSSSLAEGSGTTMTGARAASRAKNISECLLGITPFFCLVFFTFYAFSVSLRLLSEDFLEGWSNFSLVLQLSPRVLRDSDYLSS